MSNIILNKFRNTPENFIKSFIGKFTIWSFFVDNKLCKKHMLKSPTSSVGVLNWNACLSDLYKRISHQELVILWNNEFFSCKKNQYKQVIHNIRRKAIKKIKKTIISSSLPSIEEKIKIIQINKLTIYKKIFICVYDLKTNQFIDHFMPLKNIRSSPKKKDCLVMTPDLLKNN